MGKPHKFKEKFMGGAYGAAFRSALDYDHNRRVRARIDELDAYLIPPAQQKHDEAQRVFRLAKAGSIAGLVLLPLGIIGAGLAMVGGLPRELAEMISTLGVGAAGLGGVLKFFFCSPKRVKELEERANQAKKELDDLIYERDSLARTIR